MVEIVQNENRTCIMITHNLNHAIQYGDRLLLLKEGSFVAEYNALEKKNLTPLQLISFFEKM